MNPKVTFAMPTINDEFLGEAIDSILNQTLTEWELFIYNNQVGRKLKSTDERIIIFETPNWQIHECFNHAHRVAKSNILMHQDDDDISFPHRAEITYNEIMRGADLFCGSYVAVNEKGKIKFLFNPSPFNESMLRYIGGTVPLMCAGYRINRAPYYDDNFPALHDYVFLMKYIRQGGKFSVSSTPLAIKRILKKGFQEQTIEARKKETFKARELFGDFLLRSKRVMVPINLIK